MSSRRSSVKTLSARRLFLFAALFILGATAGAFAAEGRDPYQHFFASGTDDFRAELADAQRDGKKALFVMFEQDGLPTHRRTPRLVVIPGTREEVIAVMRLLSDRGVPVVPRGAGTGLSGGALADEHAVLLVLTRLNRILNVDPVNRLAVVEPGVVNARLSAAAAPYGLQYAPDPSSQAACQKPLTRLRATC